MTEDNYFAEVIERLGVPRPPKPNYRDLAFQWLAMGREERIANNMPTNQRDYAYSIGIGATSMKAYKREFFALNMKDKVLVAKEKVERIGHKPITDEEKLALARKVYAEAMQPAAKSKDKELAIRMLGMLIDKSEQEITVKLDADTIARRNLKADRELEEYRGTAGYRVEEVQEEPPLLS